MRPAPIAPPVVAAPIAPPAPHVVVQPRGWNGGLRLITPDRVWLFSSAQSGTTSSAQNGLSQIDAATGIALAALPISDRVIDVVLSRDGRDAFLIRDDARQIRAGVVATDVWHTRTVLERWVLATATRRWSRDLEGGEHGSPNEHVSVGAHGVVVTRCFDDARDTQCTAYDVAADTGEQHARATFTTRIGPRGFDRVESASGRFVLRGREVRDELVGERMALVTKDGSAKPYTKPPEAPLWTIYDDRGNVRANIRTACARFDRDDTLWLDRADPAAVTAVRALGIDVRDGRAACTSPTVDLPPVPYDSPSSGVADKANIAVTATHIVWSSSATPRVVALDMRGPGFPSALALPALRSRKTWWLQDGGPTLRLNDDARTIELADVGSPPLERKLPRDAFVWSDGDELLAGWFVAGYQTAHAIASRTSTGALRWQPIAAPSAPRLPGFTVIERNNKRTVVVAGGRYGVQYVDAASGRLLERVCGTPKSSLGTCTDDDVTGLLASPDHRTAWLHRETTTGSRRVSTFDEIDFATARVLRSVPAPDLGSGSPDYELRWLEPGRRFWFATDNNNAPGACIDIVTLGDQVTQTQHCYAGRSAASDLLGRFLVTFRAIDTLEVMRPDGSSALTVALRGTGAFAVTPDGRFACTGEGCADLRCVVGNEAHPVDDTACATLRAPGFSVLDEVARGNAPGPDE